MKKMFKALSKCAESSENLELKAFKNFLITNHFDELLDAYDEGIKLYDPEEVWKVLSLEDTDLRVVSKYSSLVQNLCDMSVGKNRDLYNNEVFSRLKSKTRKNEVLL